MRENKNIVNEKRQFTSGRLFFLQTSVVSETELGRVTPEKPSSN